MKLRNFLHRQATVFLPHSVRESSLFRESTYPARRIIQNYTIKNEQREFEKVEPIANFKCSSRLFERGIQWPPRGGVNIHNVFLAWRGTWEQENIVDALAALGDVTIITLDDFDIPKNEGRITLDLVDRIIPKQVENIHKNSHVTAVWSYLSGASVYPRTIEKINALGIATFAFHFDDKLSFRGVSKDGMFSGPISVCNCYDLNLTNAPSSIVKYQAMGADAIFWPEGASDVIYHPLNLKRDLDLVFIGGRYGKRKKLIEYLKRHGIDVTCFGSGWGGAFLSSKEVNEIYSRAKIVLGAGWVSDSDYQCLKARDFEAPMAGAAYLTTHNPELELVYSIGEELEVYRDFQDCVDKIKKLLLEPKTLEELRIKARKAAIERHQWKFRFDMVLRNRTHDFLEKYNHSLEASH